MGIFFNKRGNSDGLVKPFTTFSAEEWHQFWWQSIESSLMTSSDSLLDKLQEKNLIENRRDLLEELKAQLTSFTTDKSPPDEQMGTSLTV